MPSLTVRVFKFKNKDIEDITEKCPPVLLDDSISQIKDKLFASELALVPNLLKIQIKKDNTYITIKGTNTLLYEAFEHLPEKAEIYITYLEDIIETLHPEELYIHHDRFKETLDNLKGEYTSLTENELQFLVNVWAVQNNMGSFEDIEDFMSSLKTAREKVVDKLDEINEDSTYQELYKIADNFETEIDNVVYNDITVTIRGNDVISGSKGVFIKLNEIFNILELNEEIPFISLGKKSSSTRVKQPQIKIYNELINNVNDKEIKSWVLNEKKKLNEATYKIIKGLMLKIKIQNIASTYLTMNILPNGIIYANLKMTKETSNLTDIINLIKVHVDKVIDYINTLKTVFLYSKRLVNIKSSKLTIDSVDATIETTRLINRNKFDILTKTPIISHNLLEIKRTESTEVLSAYYKKFKIKESAEEIKGITINIKDNPYKADSSIIKIYSANNQNQAFIIVWTILLLSELSELVEEGGFFGDFKKKRKIRQKSNKKQLKEQGIEFDPKECQANRQPQLNPNNESPIVDDGYNIIFNDKNYKCNNDKFPYPGFTKNNVVCCFKQNQTGHESYIKNVDPNSLDILVEPSNFKITIKEKDKSFETFVIKIVSDYNPGFNETNSMPRYYYLSPTKNKLTSENDIIPIYNKKLIQQIEDEENIWLDRVPLSQIIYPSASNKCTHKPDLNNRTGINKPCQVHKQHKYFGYTSKSIPCCFDKEREPYVTRKKKEADITKQYIIKSADKTLNHKQIGIMGLDLEKIFNDIMKSPDGAYYRMGIIQNNSSFLNALLLSVNNTVRGTSINNHSEFKKFIGYYLNKNLTEFTKLNNGDISNKYGSIESYLKYINNQDTFLNWLELVDLLERVLKRNIMVFDVTDATRLLCRGFPLNLKKMNRPFIILLKKKNTFEVIVQLVTTSDMKNDIIKEFNYENKIITFLTNYYKDTCVRKNVYPESFNYISLPHYSTIVNKLKTQTPLVGTVKYQIKNDFNKINMLMTRRGLLIPILETGIIDNPEIKVVSFSSLIRQQDKLLKLKDYENAFKALNKLLNSTKERINIAGIIDSNITTIGGIVTNQNYIIPYLKTSEDSIKFTKFDYIYYLDADKQLHAEQHKDTVLSLFSKQQDNLSMKLFNLTKLVGDKVSSLPDIKTQIDNIIKDTAMEKGDKIISILDIFYDIGIPQENEALLASIANEIINDNKEQLILNNIITSDSFNKNDVIVRTSESILLNLDDIRKWAKKHQQLV